MRKVPFYAEDMSLDAKKFLYSCAFWVVAADEQLKPSEQEWLIRQFGPEGATKSLDEFVALESKEFFQAFDASAEALTDEERGTIFPKLEEWLLSCVEVDSVVSDAEKQIIQKIKDRLSLGDGSRGVGKTADRHEDGMPASRSIGYVGDSRISFFKSGLSGEVRILTGHDGEVTSVDVSPDGTRILSASEDGIVKLWDFAEGSALRTLKGHETGVGDVCFCCGGRRALSGDRMGQVKLWDIETGKVVWTSDQKRYGGVIGLAAGTDGKKAVFVSDTGIVCVLDIANGQTIKIFGEKKRGALHDVAFSPDCRFVLAGGDDKTMRLWNAADGKEMMAFDGHDDGVIGVCFSPDGRHVLSGSRDNTVRLWDSVSGEEERVFKGHTFSVYSVCFSPDGGHILSGSWDHTVKMWNVQTGALEFSMESLDSRFSGVVFHPDGKSIIAGGSNKAVYVVRLDV